MSRSMIYNRNRDLLYLGAAVGGVRRQHQQLRLGRTLKFVQLRTTSKTRRGGGDEKYEATMKTVDPGRIRQTVAFFSHWRRRQAGRLECGAKSKGQEIDESNHMNL